MSAPRFQRSSFCGGGNCVEVAALPGSSGVLVRDSKRPDRGAQRYTAEEWRSFLAGVKAGEFDLPPES